MSELSNFIPAGQSIVQQDINEQEKAPLAQILPDEHIDPFRLYPTAQVGPVVLSGPATAGNQHWKVATGQHGP